MRPPLRPCIRRSATASARLGQPYVCCHRCALPHVQVAPVPHDHPDGQVVAFGNDSLAPGTYEAAAAH